MGFFYVKFGIFDIWSFNIWEYWSVYRLYFDLKCFIILGSPYKVGYYFSCISINLIARRPVNEETQTEIENY